MKRNRWMILSLVLVSVLLAAGCPTESSPSEPVAEVIDDNYDVLVVGVGSSGHVAMIAAAAEGAKVIAIEQSATPGPMMSAGIAAAESTAQKIAGGQINDPSTGGLNPNALFTWFTKDDLFKALIDYSHNTANGPLVRRIVDNSGPNLDWLADRGLTTTLQLGSDQGMHITDQYLQTYHMHNTGWPNLRDWFDGKTSYTVQPGWGSPPGASPTTVTFPTVNAVPGTVRTNTRAIDLIMDSTGKKVIGVLAEDVTDHHPIKIYAKKVILCTGGYGPATDKFKELLELEHLQFYAFGGEGNTGSGIEMAVNTAGAKLWGDHSFMLHNNVARKADGSAGNELAGSALFFLYNWEAIPCVNTEGRRFMNEKLVSNSALWANASYSQGGTYFIVFSKGILDELETSGITQPMWYIGAVSEPGSPANVSPFTAPTQQFLDIYMSFGLMSGAFSVSSGHPVPADRFDGSATPASDGNTLKSITDAAEDFASKGWIYKGNTIAELAQNAGMSDPQVLVNTLAKYNAAVQNAASNSYNAALPTTDEFGKGNNYLTHEIKDSEGPFYAMRLSLSSLGGSSGGIMVDSNLQVLDNSYHTIPGLYAAGLNAGGFYGPVSTYYDYEGSAMMFATNSGRIAGEEAGKAAKAGL
jgi:fumarate reductase flavoprotein subunit